MGKGIALMFRDAFPENTRAYEQAAQQGAIRVGEMFTSDLRTLVGPRWIINFPTKKHWRQPSRLEWVRTGLQDLVRVVRANGIRSIALPPLGCGNGGLQWAQVRPEIEAAAAMLPEVEFIVYEPTDRYLNAPKRSGVETLTPARALVAELVRRYSIPGLDCTNLEVQKLAWFLHRSIVTVGAPDPLDLRFQANKYGPYSDRLRHLLDGLDGSYLHCDKRLSDAGPLDEIRFEDGKADALHAYLDTAVMDPFRPALTHTSEIIDGFESPLGLELLATVDWLLSECGVAATVEGIRQGLDAWPAGAAAARRKQGLFDDRLLRLALERLGEALPASVG
jgi:O-acetyl-ADP-ribose deacetylase (regulator of RNase III)